MVSCFEVFTYPFSRAKHDFLPARTPLMVTQTEDLLVALLCNLSDLSRKGILREVLPKTLRGIHRWPRGKWHGQYHNFGYLCPFISADDRADFVWVSGGLLSLQNLFYPIRSSLNCLNPPLPWELWELHLPHLKCTSKSHLDWICSDSLVICYKKIRT